MAYKTCETCEHYRPYSSPVTVGDFYERACLQDEWHGECAKMSSASGHPEEKGTLAFASDCESYGAGVVVKQSFGCNMHELRERDHDE